MRSSYPLLTASVEAERTPTARRRLSRAGPCPGTLRGVAFRQAGRMSVVIRDLGDADLRAVGEVFRLSSLSNERDRPLLEGHPELLVWAPHPNQWARTRVATQSGEVIGFATTVPTLDGLELDDLFVRPDGMRRGVGRALVDDAVAHARARRAPA